MWLNIAILVVSVALQVALAPRPEKPRPTAFADIGIPLSDEGEEMDAVFGQCWTPSWQVLTVGNYRTSSIKSSGK